MSVPDLIDWHPAALLIEAIGSLVILGYVLLAVWWLLRGDVVRARLLIADGVIAGLNFKVAASLLKLIGTLSWTQIGLFVVTLALRTLLKRVFAWERARLARSSSSPRAALGLARPPE